MKHLPTLYLASASPRRRELLDQVGVRHQAIPMAVDESHRPGESVQDFVVRLAITKAQAGWDSLPVEARRPVLGADTVVVVDDTILGKPADEADALAMMARLSGRSHRVLSAVALVQADVLSRYSESQVTFRETSEAERRAYWRTGEPCDKAGAYGIQGMGALFVTRLEGSYSGVMGLPLFETAQLMQAAGIPVLTPVTT